MAELFDAVPVGVWLVLAALGGAVVTLAWPAAVDLWWLAVETATAWLVRFVLVVGVLALVAVVVSVLLVAAGAMQLPWVVV